MSAAARTSHILNVVGLIVLVVVLAAALQAYRGYRLERPELHPQRGAVALPTDAKLLGIRQWRVPTTRGTISAWFVPPHGGGTVVILHGMQADRSSMLTEIRALVAAGHGIVALDFPGHGESDGVVDLVDGRIAAIKAIVDSLTHCSDVDPSRIGLLGFSFGGTTAAQYASRDTRIRAVAIAAGPASFVGHVRFAYRNSGALLTNGALLMYRLHSADLSQVEISESVRAIAPRPALLINGEQDSAVPPGDGRVLAQAIGPSATVWLVRGAGHGDYAASEPLYGAHLASWFTAQLR